MPVFVSARGSTHKFPGSGESENRPGGLGRFERGRSPTQTRAGRIFPSASGKLIVTLCDINTALKTSTLKCNAHIFLQ